MLVSITIPGSLYRSSALMAFQMKANTEPTGNPSIKTSSLPIPGVRIVVSQYGGVASAAACSYD